MAAALADTGRAVLAVDLDPQAALTFSLGHDPDELDATVADALVDGVPLAQVVLAGDETDLVPANLDLAAAEVALMSRTGREHALRLALAGVADTYDVILLDCPPSLGVLTINALTAAHRVVVPVQGETLSHRGVGHLLATVDEVRTLTNPSLEVVGVVATMHDPRLRHAAAVLDDLERRYGLEVVGVPVRRSVRFAEAPRDGRSVLVHAPGVPGAAAYRVVAAALVGDPVDADLRAAAGALSA